MSTLPMAEMNTAPKPFVFVLMPFAPEFEDVYEFGIKAACAEAGAHCERVDKQIFDGMVMERVYNQIAKADIIVADMSDQNANVFYETGYAHALGKRVILLTRDAADIPFDIQQYPHVIYAGRITKLKEGLLRRLQWYITHPVNTEVPNEGLEFFVGREPLDGQVIRGMSPGEHRFKLVIHNAGRTNLKGVSLAMIASGGINGVVMDSTKSRSSDLPDGSDLFRLPPLEELLPDEWSDADVRVYRKPSRHTNAGGFTIDHYDGELPCPMILRACYETGPRDLNFVLEFPADSIRRSKAKVPAAD